MRILLALIVLALLSAPTAEASSHSRVRLMFSYAARPAVAQPIHIIGGPVPGAVKRALLYQMNVQLRRHWGTPAIEFSDHGWPVYVISYQDLEHEWCSNLDYCAAPSGLMGLRCVGRVLGVPGAEVGPEDRSMLSIALSHEIIEMLVNPGCDRQINGWSAEAADPVANDYYQVGPDDVAVSDFVFPRWFTAGSRGPWDFQGWTHHASDYDAGYAAQQGG